MPTHTLWISNAADVQPTYYVDATGGNDANDGLSAAAPWQTIAKVNAASLNPGNRVLFKRGEMFTGQLAPVTSGTAGMPIVYGAYGTGNRPIIDGSALRALYIPIGAGSTCFLEYHDIDFSGGDTSYAMVHVYTHDVLLEDCEVHGALGYGIAMTATAGDTIYNNTIRRCNVYSNALSGIVSSDADPNYPKNMILEDSSIYNNGTSESAHHGVYVDGQWTIRNNICYGNAAAGIKCNSEFGYNALYVPTAYNNTCYDNGYGFVMSHNGMTVYNNLCYLNHHYNIQFEAGIDDCIVVFNTFANSADATGSRGVWFSPTLNTGMIFKNNLVIQDSAVVSRECLSRGGGGALVDVPANNTFDYNLYYYDKNAATHIFIDDIGGSLTFAEWQVLGSAPDTHSHYLVVEPGFVTRYTDYHPEDGGNLKGEGVAIAGYALDKDGNTRANPPTPGCYEEAAA